MKREEICKTSSGEKISDKRMAKKKKAKTMKTYDKNGDYYGDDDVHIDHGVYEENEIYCF
jgi:hypothetical protein